MPRSVIQRRLREIGNVNKQRLPSSSLSFRGINSENDSFKAGERRSGGSVGGVDTREVNGGEKREEREDNETEIGVGGEVSVVEPVTEGIGAGS